jgi:hypothetical protein
MNSAAWKEKMRDEYDPLDDARERAREEMYSIAPSWCKNCTRLQYNKYDDLSCEDPVTDDIHFIDRYNEKQESCPIIKGENHGTTEETTGTERIKRAC